MARFRRYVSLLERARGGLDRGPSAAPAAEPTEEWQEFRNRLLTADRGDVSPREAARAFCDDLQEELDRVRLEIQARQDRFGRTGEGYEALQRCQGRRDLLEAELRKVWPLAYPASVNGEEGESLVIRCVTEGCSGELRDRREAHLTGGLCRRCVAAWEGRAEENEAHPDPLGLGITAQHVLDHHFNHRR